MNWIASTQLSLFAGFLAAVATILMVRRFRLLRQISVHRLDQAADVAFILFVLVWLVIWGALNLGKFESFNMYGTDFALFDQVIWNTQRGRFLENSVIVDAPVLLAQRFSPILVMFVPLYAIWSDSRILALVPPVAIAIAVLLLYRFARRVVGRLLGFVVGGAFLLAPGLQSIALFQFKEIILTIPLLMLAATFLLERRYVPFLVGLALALMCKEEVGLIAAMLGVYILLCHRRYLLGSLLAIGGVVWVVFLLQVVIPFFSGGSRYYYFGSGAYSGSGLYDYLGSSLPEILQTVLTRPDIVWQNVVIPEKAQAVGTIFLPLFIVALFGVDILLPVLPTLGYTLLSNRHGQFMAGSEHYSPTYVFLFLASVVGLERLIRWWSSRSICKSAERRLISRVGLGVFLTFSVLLNYYFNGSGPLSQNFVSALYTPTAHSRIGAEIVEQIPADAVVMA
jgi:uncharacterized membrane protein